MEPRGGFDAVIGNPPWDRIKLQEVEWFAARRPEIAHATRADERRRMIGALKEKNDRLHDEYEAARDQADRAAAVARGCGDYPLLSGGDINIYALFVERAHALIKASGVVGLLVPSGLASDLGASRFFRHVSTSGRLAALFDFENKKFFFPDIDTRFKFSVYVAGGREQTFDKTDCAFYLHDVDQLSDANRRFSLAAEDFARVNPNTGTAPVFRTRRDAELTTAIYARVPVLVDRRKTPLKQVWPVRQFRMFDMTNAAALFRTRQQLAAEGFYPIPGNRWRKADEEHTPLYEGKMVQAFDHRAAGVTVNPENLNRPAQPDPANSEQHRDPKWQPEPQYWVPRTEVDALLGANIPFSDDAKPIRISPDWFIAFKDVTAPTNVRTMIEVGPKIRTVG